MATPASHRDLCMVGQNRGPSVGTQPHVVSELYTTTAVIIIITYRRTITVGDNYCRKKYNIGSCIYDVTYFHQE